MEQKLLNCEPQLSAFLSDIIKGEDTFLRLGLESGYFEQPTPTQQSDSEDLDKKEYNTMTGPQKELEFYLKMKSAKLKTDNVNQDGDSQEL